MVSPPSACPSCGAQIRNRHNVPVLGLAGAARPVLRLPAPISARYPLVEAGTAAAVRRWRRCASLTTCRLLPAYLCFAAIGVALALIDLDVKRLPNAIVLPSYPVLAALLALDTDPHALLRAAIGAAVLFAFYLVVALARAWARWGSAT